MKQNPRPTPPQKKKQDTFCVSMSRWLYGLQGAYGCFFYVPFGYINLATQVAWHPIFKLATYMSGI